MSRMMAGIASLLAAGLALTSCGDASIVAGNSANTGNAQASGRIVTSSGAPVFGAWVECRPDSLTPWDPQLPGWSSLTDSTGRYLCTDLPYGPVGIAASEPGSALSHWHADTLSASSQPDSGTTDTLVLPGRLRVALPPGTIGTLYLTGLGITVPVHGEQELEISDVPAGWAGKARIARSVSIASTVDSGLHVLSGKTDSAGYTRRSTTIRVALAGGLKTALAQFPLLVRLDSSWQGFATSLPDGSDLRLSTTTGKALPLTVAAWDRGARTGSLWTTLDSLAVPGDSVDLVLGWGIPVPATSSAAAFASSSGWIAAWPLGDTGTTISDRLGSFPGTATSTSTTQGVISKASSFDGRLSRILIPGSSTGSLDVPEGGPYTWSCWVRLKDFGTSRFVMGRGEQGSNLKFQKTFGSDTNSWLAKDLRSSPAGGYYTMAHADTAVWTHLAMTVSGTTVSLYVNGTREAIDSGFNIGGIGKRAELFAIGAATDTLGNTSQHFFGDLAEAWVQSATRSADWIRLVAANQKPGAAVAKTAK